MRRRDPLPAPAPEEQRDLFLAALPARPYVSDDLTYGQRITSQARALRRRYIQANPPWLRINAVFDVDRSGAVGAWEVASLPAPLWACENRASGIIRCATCAPSRRA